MYELFQLLIVCVSLNKLLSQQHKIREKVLNSPLRRIKDLGAISRIALTCVACSTGFSKNVANEFIPLLETATSLPLNLPLHSKVSKKLQHTFQPPANVSTSVSTINVARSKWFFIFIDMWNLGIMLKIVVEPWEHLQVFLVLLHYLCSVHFCFYELVSNQIKIRLSERTK